MSKSSRYKTEHTDNECSSFDEERSAVSRKDKPNKNLRSGNSSRENSRTGKCKSVFDVPVVKDETGREDTGQSGSDLSFSSSSPKKRTGGPSDAKKFKEDNGSTEDKSTKKKIFFTQPIIPPMARFGTTLNPVVRGLQQPATYASPPYFKNSSLLLPSCAPVNLSLTGKEKLPPRKISDKNTVVVEADTTEKTEVLASVATTLKSNITSKTPPFIQHKVNDKCAEEELNSPKQTASSDEESHDLSIVVNLNRSQSKSPKSTKDEKLEECSVVFGSDKIESKNTNLRPGKSKKKNANKLQVSKASLDLKDTNLGSQGQLSTKRKASKPPPVVNECSKSMPSWHISNVTLKTNEALYRIGLAEVAKATKIWSDSSNTSYMDSQSTFPNFTDTYREVDNIEGPSFTTDLMSTIKNKLHYSRFCFSIPKSRIFGISFQNVMNDVANIFDHYQYSDPNELSPLEMSSKRAKGIIQDQNEREEKASMSKEHKSGVKVLSTVNADNPSNSTTVSSFSCSVSSNSFDSLIELPHSLILMISDQNKCLKNSYPGQFVCFVNPKHRLLSLHFFEYVPFYDENFQIALESNNLTGDDFKSIQSNMENFELSRELKMQINLGSIIDVKLLNYREEKSLAVLKVVFAGDPFYYQRWIHSSSPSHNRWSSCCNFLTLFKDGDIHSLIVISFLQEVSDIAALIYATLSMPNDFAVLEKDALINSTSDEIQNNKKSIGIHNKESFNRIDQILNVLVKFKFISPPKANEVKMNLTVTSYDNAHTFENIKDIHMNYFSAINLPSCLKDFIIIRCKDGDELEQILTTPLSRYELKGTAKNIKLPNKSENIDKLTVADFISLDDIFFSFCFKTLLEKSEYYHCKYCKHCSKLKKLPGKLKICSRCGFSSKGKVILFPQSLFSKGTYHKMLILPSEEPPDLFELFSTSALNDIEIPVDMKNIRCSAEECNQDALGLMDPLAYLLGLKPRDSVKSQNKDQYVEKSNKYGKDFATMMSIMTGKKGPSDQGISSNTTGGNKPPMPMCVLQ